MPVNADILNLFLGVKPTTGATPTGQPTAPELGSNDDGALFADILGMISNPNPAIQTPTKTDTSEKLCGPFAPVWMLGRAEHGAGQPSTNIDSSTADSAVSISSPKLDANTVDGSGSAPTAVQFAVPAQLQGMNVAEPTVLKDGLFEVLDSHVQDGTADLTLKSKDSGETIRVSLPLEELLQGTNPTLATMGRNNALGDRVSLHGDTPKNLELSSLFDKLQLTELKVESSTSATNADSPLKLTLSSTPQMGAGIEISLPQSEIKAFRLSNLGNRLSKTNIKESGGSGSPLEFGLPTPTVAIRPVVRVPHMLSGDDSNMMSLPFESTDSATTISNFIDSKTPVTAFSQEMKATISQSGERVEFGSVRFTLPDQLEQTLTPGGKTVLLKIHPEHLGPARLNLNWNGDGLSARVTVDSPLAQTAIEKSLDKLQDQLAQAGIKVDHIGVSLSGGHARGQFNHGQGQWQKQSSSHTPIFSHDYRAAEYVSAIPASVGVAQYVGSQGVNIFA